MTAAKKGVDWVSPVLLLLEVAFVLLGLFGVWHIYWPASFVLGSVLGVVALERLQAVRKAPVAPVRRMERIA